MMLKSDKSKFMVLKNDPFLKRSFLTPKTFHLQIMRIYLMWKLSQKQHMSE